MQHSSASSLAGGEFLQQAEDASNRQASPGLSASGGDNVMLAVAVILVTNLALSLGDAAIKHIAEAEKLDEKTAANRLRQLPQSGRLNLPGLQSVLDLRVQFGLVPPLGKDLARYYEENFYRESSK